MALLGEVLPPAKSTSMKFYDHTNDSWSKQRFSSSAETELATVVKHNLVPPYLKRHGFVPRKVEDFGDGGSFPEIHIAQYPVGMGRDKSGKPGSKILPAMVDGDGNFVYDAIVKQNENSRKIVYSQYKDLVPKILGNEEDRDKDDCDVEKEIETAQETKAALEKIVNMRLSVAQPKNVPEQSSESEFIKYKPSQQSAVYNSGAKERIIRMVEMPTDPLEPPKFKHKKVPKASGSPPVPIMHSPPRPVTVKDQQDWKIPPCISNWKNPNRYSIPLDKRLAADGRGLQEVQINDNFANLAEALYVVDQKAREAVTMRLKVQKELLMKETVRKERELRALAQKARSERIEDALPAAVPVPPSEKGNRDDETRVDSERDGRMQREKICEERHRERKRKQRLDAKDVAMGKKSKKTRDRDRDISEKAALGMASTGGSREVMYDTRLFNQEKGMNSGFSTDDQYNIYDRGLFTAQATLSTLYRPSKDMDSGMYGRDAIERFQKILKTDRFKADKPFSGASERGRPRDRLVEFENDAEEADPYGLDQLLMTVKKGKKAMDNVARGGTMRASGGSATRDGNGGGSGQTRIDFQRGR